MWRRPLRLRSTRIQSRPTKVESERRIFTEQVKAEGKPEHMIEKIVEGKIQAYYKDVALMHQAWVREPKKTIGDLVKEVSAKTGENVQVRRFARSSWASSLARHPPRACRGGSIVPCSVAHPAVEPAGQVDPDGFSASMSDLWLETVA
jgi:translation elongation factor EF-Ts